ncbi:competence type IV pilus assembly protein ComGB [Bacillus piscicola]|uniref:competence type IV pilus assembly protein ComGB n=1 Tax=Bacillus piscicola TaxID=1632684 RepID=UPI001F08F48B|nr:competence type IV pilus assembly protein ComGB [Bacillus piscicola]
MGKKWKSHESADFLVKVGELLEQGYSIDQVLELLSWEQPDIVKSMIIEMREELRRGTSFHEILRNHYFPSDITAYVFFSESCGALQEGLQGAGELYRKRIETTRRIRRYLRYPLLLLWTLLIISIVMLHFLFPQFSQLFDSLDMEFPMVTLIMIQFFRYSPYLAFSLVPIVLLLFVYYFKTFRHYSAHKQCHLLFQIPFLAPFLRLFFTYYFSLQLSSMLKGGLSIYEACQVFERQDHFEFFQAEGSFLKAMLKEGNSLSEALENKGWYRTEMKYVVQHGQTAGRLGDDLYYYSERVLRILEDRVKKVVMTVQPIMFCMIGLVILAMFLSVFLPMFQLMTSM